MYEIVDEVPLLGPRVPSEQHEHQRAYFDAQFAAFGAYQVDPWRRSFIDRISAALVPGLGGLPYLDVGVGGSGATVIEAARAGVEAVGCDLSVKGVLSAARFAREEGVDDQTTFVVCAAEALPFSDGSIGGASAVAVLEHLDDDGAAVAELARVVRPGGRVWVTVPHTYRHIPVPVWPLYRIHDYRIGHRRHYGAEHLKSLVEAYGFRLLEIQFTGHPIKFLQFALTTAAKRVGRNDSELWRRLEQRDLSRITVARGALQISAVFERLPKT